MQINLWKIEIRLLVVDVFLFFFMYINRTSPFLSPFLFLFFSQLFSWVRRFTRRLLFIIRSLDIIIRQATPTSIRMVTITVAVAKPGKRSVGAASEAGLVAATIAISSVVAAVAAAAALLVAAFPVDRAERQLLGEMACVEA